MIPKIRNIIIFVIIAVAFVLIYIFFIKSSSPQASLVSSSASTSLPDINGSLPGTNTSDKTSLVAKDFLTLLLSVKNIKLVDTIFSDQAFNSLHDSSIILIQDGTEGRPNPFAQFGNDSIPASPNVSSNTSTIPPLISPSILITPPATPTTTAPPTTPIPAKPPVKKPSVKP